MTILKGTISFGVVFVAVLILRVFGAPLYAFDAAKFSWHLSRCTKCRSEYQRRIALRRMAK